MPTSFWIPNNNELITGYNCEQVAGIRILIEVTNQLYKVFKIFWRETDASIYVVPYAVNGKYYSGINSFEKDTIKTSFNFTEQFDLNKTPHLSIHQSGDIQTTFGKKHVGPLTICSLDNLRGQHVATINPDSFNGLPNFKQETNSKNDSANIASQVTSDEVSRRFLICINGKEPRFSIKQNFILGMLTLERQNLSKPIFVGIFGVRQDAINAENAKPGVTIMSGWNPNVAANSEMKFIWIRGM